jgi:hypothetical protein
VKKWLLATTGELVTASICFLAGPDAARQFGVQLPAMIPAALGSLLILLAPVWWPKAAALRGGCRRAPALRLNPVSPTRSVRGGH